MGPPVSVVIATRDRRQELVRTVERLLALPERPRVIVVDNASRDGSATAVRERFPDVKLIGLARNAGAVARNVGVRAARTPYVAFSDDDSWWEPGALSRAVAALDDHPAVGLVAARTVVGDARVDDPINAALADSPIPAEADLPGPPVLGFLACASVVRKQAFQAVDGFNPLLFFVGEERLLAYDLRARGWRCCYLSDVVAVHRPSSRRPPSDSRRRAELRNALLTCWLRRPLRTALIRTGRLAAAGLRDRNSAVALGGVLLRLPAALWHRRPLPPEVERAARILEGPA